jgi:hypothetical protein
MAKFEVLTVVLLLVQVFWGVTLSRWINSKRLLLIQVF